MMTSASRLHKQVSRAIRRCRSDVRWKPNKDIQHLQTRIDYGHLPADTTLDDYNAIIKAIVEDANSAVYVYHWHQDFYPTVTRSHQGRQWLVMFNVEGIMETAFPPDDPEEYLADPRFEYLGKLEELL